MALGRWRTCMTWWSISYLSLFVILAVAGLVSDFRDKRPFWFLVLAIASNATVIYLFVAFWSHSLRLALGVVAPLLFVAALCWEVFRLVTDIREIRNDTETTANELRTIVGIILAVLLPAFIVAGMSAFRGL